MSNYTLRAFLMQWQFWALEAQFACVVVTTLIEARRLAVARATVAAGCVVAVCAYLITATVPPRTSRIYYDEQIYQGVARNLTDLHRAQMCNEGVVEYGRLDCHQGEYNKEPYGYPYLLSVVYRVTGVSDHAAFRFNNVVAGLAVLVTMVLADLLFQDFRVAILSGLTLALFPMQVQWGNTAAAEPAAALFCAASAAAAAHFARARTTSALVWAVALGGFTITVRPECVLIVPVMAAAIALLAPDEFRRPRLWLAALGGAVFVSMSLLHLAAVRNEGWGAASAAMGWVYAGPNFKVNFWFFFGDQRFPVLCGVAALAGLAAGAARLRERLFLLIYFLAFWLVFLFFYAGSYNYGADVRYSLMVYVPAAILAAVGLLHIAGAASRMLRLQLSDRQRLAAAIVVVLASFSWYAPLVRATGEEAWGARADVAVAKEFAARLPPNAMVLTHNPSMFHLWNVNAAQTSTIRSNPRFGDYFFPRYAGGVYLHWNYWCNVPDRVQNAFCQEVLSAFPHELVESRRVRDFEYRLYRLRPPPPPLPPPPLAP